MAETGRQTKSQLFETSQGPLNINVTQLGGLTAGKLAIRLGKVIAPAAAEFAGVEDGDAVLAKAVALFVDRLVPEEFESVLLLFLTSASCDTPKGTVPLKTALVEELFAGRVEGLVQLFKFAFEVNFASFFDVIQTEFRTAVAAKKAKTASSGPPSA